MIKQYRLKLIEERAKLLEQAQKEGLVLSKHYRLQTLIYCKVQEAFGKVIADEEEYLIVDFGKKQTTYYRDGGTKSIGSTAGNRKLKPSASVKKPKLPAQRLTLIKHSTTAKSDGTTGKRQKAKDKSKVIESQVLVEKKAKPQIRSTVLKKEKKSKVGGSKKGGIFLERKRFFWTAEKDHLLLHSPDKTTKEIALQLNTSIASVKGRLRRLRDKGHEVEVKRSCFTWKAKDDNFLLQNQAKSYKWIAEQLETSIGSVKGRLRRLRAKGLLK